MKKKTMQAWFVVLFVIGIIVGWFIPGDFKTLTKKASGNALQPQIFDIPKNLGQLDKETDYFKYSSLAQTETGGIELIRLDDRIPLHKHPKENHFVYVFKGRVKGTVGDLSSELWPGQLVAIPAGVPHSLERIGDTPVELIVFSTPPFNPNDTVFLENK